MKLLLTLSLTLFLQSQTLKEELLNLNKTQLKTVKFIKTYTPKKYRQVALAIVWQESRFGKYLANPKDGRYGSYGIFHNLLSSVLKREGVSINKYNIERYKNLLKTYHKFALKHFLLEYKFWLRKRNQNKAIKMYNCGYGKKCGGYLNKVLIKLKLVKKYL